MLRGIDKKIFLLMIVLMAHLVLFAQQYHFVYFQADNQQPFYLKYEGKNYSSTAIGYLILPKLPNGTFTVTLGFPKNLYPEQTFNLSVNDKNYGYALKNFDAKGWGLFNFQTTNVVMNVNAAAAGSVAAKQTTTTNTSNPFGNMLADAINDSTLNQQTTTASPQPADAVLQALSAQNDSTAAAVSQPAPPTATANTNPDTALNHAPQDNSSHEFLDSFSVKNTVPDATEQNITKAGENKSKTGTDLTFLDKASNDTIHAFIPSADTLSIEKKAALADTAKGKIDNPFYDSNGAATTQSWQTPAMDSAIAKAKETVAAARVNSTCINMFGENDLEKLKKKIISQKNQDAILKNVRKSLNNKCITVEQVKDLGNLFLSDENRYNFYDAAYPFVYDYGKFPQLEDQLIDTYYKNRFRALLR